MNFRQWLWEADDRDYNFYRRLVLGKLSLDPDAGVEQTLNSWEPGHLIHTLNTLGEYRNLPDPVRSRVEARVNSRVGTLGDLLRIMASPVGAYARPLGP